MGTVIQTSTTNYDKFLVTLIQKQLQENLRAPLPHLLDGNFLAASFVPGTNNTMRFLNVKDMAEVAGEDADPSAGTPPWLTEGTPPTSEDLTIGFEEFSAAQAGRVIKITDKAELQAPIKWMRVAAEKIVRNSLETADRRVARVLAGGTNVLYAGTRTRRALLRPADVLTANILRRAVASLKQDNIPAFADGYYRCIVNPAQSYDFMEDTGTGGWMNAALYAGAMPLLTGELGKFAGVRFIESGAAKVFANAGSGAPITLATSAAADDIVDTAAPHGFVLNDPIKFTALTGGTGVTVDTTYYVIAANLGAQTFQFSATVGGAAVNFSADMTAGTVAKANAVYRATLFGPGAYAFGDWGTIEVHVTPPGGHDDPLHQSALVGWKGYFGAMLVGEGVNATNPVTPRYVAIETGTGL